MLDPFGDQTDKQLLDVRNNKRGHNKTAFISYLNPINSINDQYYCYYYYWQFYYYYLFILISKKDVYSKCYFMHDKHKANQKYKEKKETKKRRKQRRKPRRKLITKEERTKE